MIVKGTLNLSNPTNQTIFHRQKGDNRLVLLNDIGPCRLHIHFVHCTYGRGPHSPGLLCCLIFFSIFMLIFRIENVTRNCHGRKILIIIPTLLHMWWWSVGHTVSLKFIHSLVDCSWTGYFIVLMLSMAFPSTFYGNKCNFALNLSICVYVCVCTKGVQAQSCMTLEIC